MFDTPSEFRGAVARLASRPVLNPIEGGIAVVLYLARPGKEADSLGQLNAWRVQAHQAEPALHRHDGLPADAFIFTLFVHQGKTPLPGSVLKVTTHYFPP